MIQFLVTSAVLGFLVFGAVRLFGWLINPEGTRVAWPIMMLQGAPQSHYAQDHPEALSLYLALTSGWGATIGLLVLAGFSFLWVRLTRALSGFARMAVDLLFVEASLCFLNVFIAAELAFHHVGWGMPCNYDWWGSLLMTHLFLGLPLGGLFLAWELDRSGLLRADPLPASPAGLPGAGLRLAGDP